MDGVDHAAELVDQPAIEALLAAPNAALRDLFDLFAWQLAPVCYARDEQVIHGLHAGADFFARRVVPRAERRLGGGARRRARLGAGGEGFGVGAELLERAREHG